MRKLPPALIPVVAGMALMGAFWFSDGEGSQAIYISPAVLSLGSVNPAETKEVSATFRLHNRTNRPLTITRALTSCMCTGLSVPDGAIPGGDLATLTMKIKTRGLRGHQR